MEIYEAASRTFNDQEDVKQISPVMNYGKAYAMRWIKIMQPETTVVELARRFNVSPSTVTQALGHISWKGDRTLTRMMFALFEKYPQIMEEL